MLTSSFTIGDWIQKYGSLEGYRNFGVSGAVPAYPIFIFIGMLLAVVAIIVEMKLRKIPLDELYWGIIIIIPTALLGATIFGKVFMIGQDPTTGGIAPEKWFHIFFFWEPGMSIFGGLFFGGISGLLWFYKASRERKISMWVYADIIVVNILIGQAVGRWGNFYNHEILGSAEVSYDKLSWLIPSIRDQLFNWNDVTNALQGLETKEGYLPIDWSKYLVKGLRGVDFSTIDLGELELKIADTFTGLDINWGGSDNLKIIATALKTEPTFHAPLFLYESLANIGLWLILTFIVPNLSRWFQPKGKYPWDIQPKAYPGWYNKKIKSMPIDDIESWSVQRPIKYKKSKDGKYTISFWEAWNKAYYLYEPNSETFDELVQNQDERNAYDKSLRDSLVTLQLKHKSDIYRFKENFERRTKFLSKNDVRYVELQKQLQEDIKANNATYKVAKKNLKEELGGWRKAFEPKPDADKLENVYNPHHYWILRCGVTTGGYIFGSLLIRIILEAMRNPDEYSIQNAVGANFAILAIILVTGLVIIFIAQFIAPYKYREAGWLYEKSY